MKIARIEVFELMAPLEKPWRIAAYAAPGLGVELDEDAVRRFLRKAPAL